MPRYLRREVPGRMSQTGEERRPLYMPDLGADELARAVQDRVLPRAPARSDCSVTCSST